MNQDAMFFIIAAFVVLALMIVGPGYVIWRYQRGGVPVSHENTTSSQDSDLT